MLKSISAALLAASILAAPALAAGTDTSATPAPAAQTTGTKAVDAKTDAKAGAKTTANADLKGGKALNAKASMHKGRHHRHYSHHRTHKHVAGVIKSKHGRAHVAKGASSVKHLSAIKTAPAKTKG